MLFVKVQHGLHFFESAGRNLGIGVQDQKIVTGLVTGFDAPITGGYKTVIFRSAMVVNIELGITHFTARLADAVIRCGVIQNVNGAVWRRVRLQAFEADT